MITLHSEEQIKAMTQDAAQVAYTDLQPQIVKLRDLRDSIADRIAGHFADAKRTDSLMDGGVAYVHLKMEALSELWRRLIEADQNLVTAVERLSMYAKRSGRKHAATRLQMSSNGEGPLDHLD